MVLAAVAFTSCINEEFVSNKEREKISLEAWIKLNKPKLLNNYQEEGGYYVEILDGDTNENISVSADGNDYGSEPLMEQDTCWVYTNMTGRDINGTICLTRSGHLAEMCGTFSYSTHYVPYINYCGSNNMGLLEGTYLSMRHELKIGEGTYKMRRGSKVRLYLPSTIAYGTNGSTTEGGYEGQYSLDASRPLILDIEVLGALKNPSEKELDMVRSYIGYEDVWTQALKPESEKTDENDDLKLKGLYYTLKFNPASDNAYSYRYIQPHLEGTNNPYEDDKKYFSMPHLNSQINDILLKRFGKGLTQEEISEENQVTKDGRANVWYILRFLDGFVVDTIAKFNEETQALDEIIQRLQDLQKRNNALVKKYNGDVKFARVHKRIREVNQERKEQGKQPMFSFLDEEIMIILNTIKDDVDSKVYDRNDILKKDAYFDKTVLNIISNCLYLQFPQIKPDMEDYMFIQSRISQQYINQYNATYAIS